MTATKTAKIPTIKATSTPNFFDVLSSDGRTHYPLLIEGVGMVSCGCPAAAHSRSCYHRNYVLANYTFINEEENYRWAALELEIHELNQVLKNAIDDAACEEAFQTMMAA